jgi:hypothetical protein
MNNKSWIIFCILSFELSAQIQNPKIWMFGYQGPNIDSNSLDTGLNRNVGLNVLDFRNNPPKLSKILKGLSLSGSNSILFDKNDSLILYANGSKVFNRYHKLIEGADSLNYGANDWANSPFAGNYFAEYNMSIFPCAIAVLPSPKNNNQFYFISVFINGDTSKFYKITSSVIDMNLNNGKGKMIEKEKTLLYGNFTEAIAACRHGNGRDWWVIAREYSNTCYKILLLDSTGVHVKNTNQCNSWDLFSANAVNRNFTSKFSWNGKYFATISFKGVEIYDFNRCTGVLSNRREIPKSTNDSSGNFSICFNKQDNFLYYNSIYKIYQYNINKNASIKVADIKLFYDTVPYRGDILPIESNFGFSQLGGDNKVYLSSTTGNFRLTTIENPDAEGIACDVRQFSFKLRTNNAGLPNYPNYELGTDTCWRSGIADGVDLNIEVYPNPASDYISIALPANVIPANLSRSQHRATGIYIYNLLGQEIYPKMENVSGGLKIDVRDMPEGIYILYIRDKNDQLLKTERIVISR